MAWMFGVEEEDSAQSAADDVRAFQRLLDDRLAGRAPQLEQCSFADALTRANAKNHVLLTIIHSELHEDADDFVDLVLSNPRFKEVILDGRFDLWGASVLSREGSKAARKCLATEYPFLAVLAGKASSTSQSFSVVARSRGRPRPEPVVRWLEAVRGVWKPKMEERVAEVLMRRREAELRDEQERRYKEIEAEDRKRLEAADEAERRRAEEAERREREERERLETADLAAVVELSARERAGHDAQRALERLPGEPSSGATIRFSLPDGTVLERRFSATDRVGAARDYVTYAMWRLGFLSVEPWQLQTRDPHAVDVDPSSDSLSLKEAGLAPSARLFVIEPSDARDPESIAREAIAGAAGEGIDVDDVDVGDDADGGDDDDDPGRGRTWRRVRG